MLEARPIELKKANEFVDKLHRHHNAVYRDKFRLAAYDGTNIVGVVQCARPVSRVLDDGKTIEVVRLCTDGTKNVCSFLYGKAARIAKEMGYSKIITYIMDSECGISLKASGWHLDHLTKGHNWSCPSRPRDTKAPSCDKQCWSKILQERDNND